MLLKHPYIFLVCLFWLIIFRHALLTNYYLQVKNSNGRIYAMGDCCTIEQRKLLSNVREIFADADKDGDGKLSLEEFKGKPWLIRDTPRSDIVGAHSCMKPCSGQVSPPWKLFHNWILLLIGQTWFKRANQNHSSEHLLHFYLGHISTEA